MVDSSISRTFTWIIGKTDDSRADPSRSTVPSEWKALTSVASVTTPLLLLVNGVTWAHGGSISRPSRWKLGLSFPALEIGCAPT